ncbi:hypothetical protein EI94DRAFT_957288 [Lactarius quietus]|nr:hypothetical protein EI94DRAFT_957288 [Lactarius quietus]
MLSQYPPVSCSTPLPSCLTRTSSFVVCMRSCVLATRRHWVMLQFKPTALPVCLAVTLCSSMLIMP